MKAGNIVFTKKFSTGHKKGSATLTLKVPMICMALGMVPKGFDGEVTQKDCEKVLIGELGLIYMDDIEECLGKKQAEKLSSWLQKKYGDESKE